MYETTRVLENAKVCEGVYSMVLQTSGIAAACAPGQFVMLKAWRGNDPFLMRPFSINTADAAAGTITVLYKVVGTGTKRMAEVRKGDASVQILGPLGNGFPVNPVAHRVAVVGRGIGIAPMRFLVETYRRQGTEVYAYLSAKKNDFLFDKELFQQLGSVVRTTTDSMIHVTSFLEEDAEHMTFDAAYSCGSNRLALDLKRLHEAKRIPVYVSLEEHMACGIGACKGCVHVAYDPQTGAESYVRVCKDGPVFPVERVIR